MLLSTSTRRFTEGRCWGKHPARATWPISHHSAVGPLPPARYSMMCFGLLGQGAGSHLSHSLLQGRGGYTLPPLSTALTSSSAPWPPILLPKAPSPHVMSLPRGSSCHPQRGPIPLRPLLPRKDSRPSLRATAVLAAMQGVSWLSLLHIKPGPGTRSWSHKESLGTVALQWREREDIIIVILLGEVR